MKKFIATLSLVLFGSASFAHEMTPTYFEIKPSIYNKVYGTELVLFNRRQDVSYYELKVYDAEWNELPFSAPEKIMKMKYTGKKRLYVFVREKDTDKLTYICTESKLVKGTVGSTGIMSRICSKIK